MEKLTVVVGTLIVTGSDNIPPVAKGIADQPHLQPEPAHCNCTCVQVTATLPTEPPSGTL